MTSIPEWDDDATEDIEFLRRCVARGGSIEAFVEGPGDYYPPSPVWIGVRKPRRPHVNPPAPPGWEYGGSGTLIPSGPDPEFRWV